MFGVVVGMMTRGLVSRRHLINIRAFFEGKDTSKYYKQLKIVLDSMEADVAWAERDRGDILTWLSDMGFYDDC